MSRHVVFFLAASLLLAAPADAQMGGGGGGMGGGGHGGRGKGAADGSQPTKKNAPSTAVANPQSSTSKIEITGVVTAIEPAASRVTIAYDAVDELNWPHGVMPFPVSKTDLLKDLKVGQKVRFKVEDHEIYALTPVDAPQKAATN